MTESTIEKVAKKNIPICTTFSQVVMQSNAEIARKYSIPEWKIEERQKIVKDKFTVVDSFYYEGDITYFEGSKASKIKTEWTN